jgi:hypothetical protein
MFKAIAISPSVWNSVVVMPSYRAFEANKDLNDSANQQETVKDENVTEDQ